MRNTMALLMAAALLAPSPVSALQTPPGQTADSSVGQAGRRQTREQATAKKIELMVRLETRVMNRVQSRLRTRIDRYYDPQANATSPFEVAGEETRTTGRPVRR